MVELKEQTEVSSTMTRAKIDTTPDTGLSRRVGVMLSPHSLIEILNGQAFIKIDGVPGDAVVVAVFAREWERTVGVILQHSTFEEVPLGQIPPLLDRAAVVVARNVSGIAHTIVDNWESWSGDAEAEAQRLQNHEVWRSMMVKHVVDTIG